MNTTLCTYAELPDATALKALQHVLIILPTAENISENCPEGDLLQLTLTRRRLETSDLADQAVSANNEAGGLRVWLMPDPEKSIFAKLSLLREAISLLLDEEPVTVDILICAESDTAEEMAALASYVALVNGTPLPNRKGKDAPKALEKLQLWGTPAIPEKSLALAAGNLLARSLIALPSNELTPGDYRQRINQLAQESAWQVDTFDLEQLRQMGAGAFVSVAQGSEAKDAAIVRISYTPAKTQGYVSLIGKGICFDTGGHNLKSADSMIGMHEDMAGSATVLGILLSTSRLQLPVKIDAWLALASNDISPRASRQGDVVTALDGTTIEIVHTDAEGRMVLADTLALAARDAPDLMIDFGTLTYTMIQALGYRYSGIFSSSEELARMALEAGRRSGERVSVFPMDADYADALDSKVADVCQCTLDEDAPDHIHAALFLKRFTNELPWLHVDLSAASCEDGLGAIGTDQTGFGVAWGIEFLENWLTDRENPN